LHHAGAREPHAHTLGGACWAHLSR
jgi:hypothetical protein